MKFRKMSRMMIAGAVIGAMVLANPLPAAAEEGGYAVAFTGGVGVWLRGAPQVGAEKFVVLPEGTMFPTECEVEAEAVTNVYGDTTTVWARAAGNVWVSTAWLDTGTIYRTPGIPDCKDLDAARAIPVQKTIGEYLRSGEPRAETRNADGTSGRIYFSKAETHRIAKLFGDAAGNTDFLNSLGCAVVGIGIGVVLTGGVGVAVGAVGGVGCDSFTGNDITKPANISEGAANTGKCFEVRWHKEKNKIVSQFTSTDNYDYCG